MQVHQAIEHPLARAAALAVVLVLHLAETVVLQQSAKETTVAPHRQAELMRVVVAVVLQLQVQMAQAR